MERRVMQIQCHHWLIRRDLKMISDSDAVSVPGDTFI